MPGADPGFCKGGDWKVSPRRMNHSAKILVLLIIRDIVF